MELIATFRLTSIRWFSKGQKCNLDLTAGASHAHPAPSCGWGCGADLRGGHAGSLLLGHVCLSRCEVAAGRPSLELARGCGAVWWGPVGAGGVYWRVCARLPLAWLRGSQTSTNCYILLSTAGLVGLQASDAIQRCWLMLLQLHRESKEVKHQRHRVRECVEKFQNQRPMFSFGYTQSGFSNDTN